MLSLAGSFVPLATPFTDDSSGISEIRLARLIRRAQDFGAAGFIVCTEAGEFSALSFGERKAMVELTVRLTQSSAAVLVNVSSLNTSASLDLAQHAIRHGARGVLLLPPYYGKFDAREVEAHFRAIVRYSESPVVVIDPFSELPAEARVSLSALGRLAMALPLGGRLGTDQFCLDEMTVRPESNLSLTPPDELSKLFAKAHPAKAIKGVSAELDIDLGPPRLPLLSLSHEDCKAAAASLA